MVRSLVGSLVLGALLPMGAQAQFTTFVAPPERVDTVMVVDTVAVTTDSVSRASIDNMKAWVDSAAGNAVDLRSSLGDTTAVPASATGDVFADGAPAPDTATPLPLLLTAGMGAVAAGVLLLRRR